MPRPRCRRVARPLPPARPAPPPSFCPPTSRECVTTFRSSASCSERRHHGVDPRHREDAGPMASTAPRTEDGDVLLDALDRLRDTGPEFDGFLANHGPMAAEALIRIGGADGGPGLGRPLPATAGRRATESSAGSAPTTGAEHLGDERLFGDWTALPAPGGGRLQLARAVAALVAAAAARARGQRHARGDPHRARRPCAAGGRRAPGSAAGRRAGPGPRLLGRPLPTIARATPACSARWTRWPPPAGCPGSTRTCRPTDRA